MKYSTDLFEEDKDLWADMKSEETSDEDNDNYIWEGMDEPKPTSEKVIELGMHKDELVIKGNEPINTENSMIYDVLRTGQVAAATDVMLKQQAIDIENKQRIIAEERKKEDNRHRKTVKFIRILLVGVLILGLLGIYLNNTEKINGILHNIFFQETVIEEIVEIQMED